MAIGVEQISQRCRHSKLSNTGASREHVIIVIDAPSSVVEIQMLQDVSIALNSISRVPTFVKLKREARNQGQVPITRGQSLADRH